MSPSASKMMKSHSCLLYYWVLSAEIQRLYFQDYNSLSDVRRSFPGNSERKKVAFPCLINNYLTCLPPERTLSNQVLSIEHLSSDYTHNEGNNSLKFHGHKHRFYYLVCRPDQKYLCTG